MERAGRGSAALEGPGVPAGPLRGAVRSVGSRTGAGTAAHGWGDQRWTLSRIKTLIGRRFHRSYTEQGVRKLLVRHGWSWQVPARRAVERDDAQVAAWASRTG